MPSIDSYLHFDDIHTVRSLTRRGTNRTRKAFRLTQKTLENLIDPRITYRVADFHADKKSVTIHLDEGIVFTSNTLSKVFSQCSKVICFAATIGKAVDREIARLSSTNDIGRAYILDTLASHAVELVTNEFQKRMGERFSSIGRTTLRFSPGYCDWDVSEQTQLFQTIDTKRIGIDLSDSCLMTPRKSISGIFGILPHAGGASQRPYDPCTDCTKKNCPERRIHF